jgi:hypothetical protein
VLDICRKKEKPTDMKCLAVCSICVVVLGYMFTCYHVGVHILSRVPKSYFLTLLDCGSYTINLLLCNYLTARYSKNKYKIF